MAIKRPEDGIQTTLSKTFATTMKHLGPYINEKVEDKVFVSHQSDRILLKT